MKTQIKRKILPCRNCISVPMCVAFLKECKDQHLINANYMPPEFFAAVSKKCSLFNDYTIEIKTLESGIHQMKYRAFYRMKKIYEYLSKQMKKD